MEAASTVPAKWALLQHDCGNSVPGEEAAPTPTVLTVKGSTQVNGSQVALPEGKAKVEGLSILPAPQCGLPTHLSFSWVLLESRSTP